MPTKKLTVLASLLLVLMSSSCSRTADQEQDEGAAITIDGSSTVFPITEAVTEEFLRGHPQKKVTIGVSGTGGGFKKLSRGEIDINNASRKIKASEVKEMEKNGIDLIELPIAYDGISVVVNKDNSWVDHLTTAELKKIWAPGSRVTSWQDIRPSWPNMEIRLYGPGTDSGTFDYFTHVINGEAGASRHDFTRSEDDNVLVQGIAGDKGALGYFGYAYYAENKGKIRAVPIRHQNGDILPTTETIKNGVYTPLSRPLFLYIRKSSLGRRNMVGFVKFYMEKAAFVISDVGYVPMLEAEYSRLQEIFTTSL